MSKITFEELSSKDFLVQLLIPFFVTLFFLQGLRTYVVNIYISIFNILWEETGYYTPLLALLAFGAPLIAILIHKKVSLPKMIAGSAILTSVFALPISLSLHYEIELLLSSLIVAFYTIFLPFYLYNYTKQESVFEVPKKAALLSTSFVLAFSYDILFRTFGTTSDPSRHLIYLPVQLFFAILIIGLVIWNFKKAPEEPNPSLVSTANEKESVRVTSKIGQVLTLAGIGFLLFIEHTILTNSNVILRWIYPVFSLLDLTIVLILTLTMMIVVTLVLLHEQLRSILRIDRWQTIVLGNILISIGLALMFTFGGWLGIGLVLIAQFFIIVNLYIFIQFAIIVEHRWSTTLLCTAFFVGFLVLILWDFLFAFTFTHSYLGDIGAIFEGQALTIVLISAVILGVTSSFAAYKIRREKK